MTFLEHLQELRTRLVRSLVAIAVGMGVAWVYREPLLSWLTEPFLRAWSANHLGSEASLHFQTPASLFFAYLKLAAIGGCVLALPVIFLQLWGFVAPGLYAREKRFALPFVFSSTLLFAAGGYFGWRIAFPVAFQYLLGLSGKVATSTLTVKPTVMIDSYLEFVAQMLLAFGLVFELPVVAFFLSLAGVINHHHLIRFARYFIVIAFVVAAVVTPPDIISQLLLAVPLCLLYGVSILVAWVFGRTRAATQSEPSPPEGSSHAG